MSGPKKKKKKAAQADVFDAAALHRRLDDALEAVNADPASVAGLRVSQWSAIARDADGNPRVHDLHAVSLSLQAAGPPVPAWPPVQPATPAVIRPVKSTGRRSRRDEVVLILPDQQFGFWHHMDTGEMTPFHDESALDISLQIARDLQPDRVVLLGDLLDFPAFSRYVQEPGFQRTTQAAVDRCHQYLAQLRAAAPDAVIDCLEGNHDRRSELACGRNFAAAVGLRSADASWPALSVPALCAFDALDVAYVGAYPGGQVWLNDRLRCIHGTVVRSGGSTASAVVRQDDVSTIFGHVHRCEQQWLTKSNRAGGRQLMAYSPGCLCRIDGAVPSVKGSTDLSGRPAEAHENWQQAVAVIELRPGDSPFHVTTAFIHTFDQYETHFGGRTYFPNSNLNAGATSRVA